MRIISLSIAFIFLLSPYTVLGFNEVWEQIRDIEPTSRNQFIKEPVRINLNTADKKTLQRIKGIGPAKAQAILDYRSSVGPLKSISDLLKVKGFTKKILSKVMENNQQTVFVE
jgi:competence ComEA-like helix-hairpin-helix protein